MGTIGILWLRQIKRYLRSRSRIVGSLGQPLLFLLALGYGLGPVFQRAGGGNYLQFLAPGVIAMSVLFTAIFSGIEIIWDRQFGFLKETLVAPVPRIHVMLGRTLGGATVATLQGVIVLVITILAGFRPANAGLALLSIVVMFLVALLFTAIGTAIASVLEDMQGFQLIMNFLVMPLFFLSGALFPLEGLPKALTVITRVNPLTYGVDALRATLSSASHFSLGLDFGVLGAFTLFFLLLGSWLFSRIEA
jgi:ABC-2 type transport system permease protein